MLLEREPSFTDLCCLEHISVASSELTTTDTDTSTDRCGVRHSLYRCILESSS